MVSKIDTYTSDFFHTTNYSMIEMASCSREKAFSDAVLYGLLRVGKPEITLKPQQLEAIRHIYEGRDVFLWLPTGFGKSVCYEVLPFVMDHKRGKLGTGSGSYSIVLVISPLVSLMVDQVISLRARGVTAAVLSGHRGVAKELQATVSDIRAMKFSLLYAAPEAIIGEDKWRTMLVNPPLSERVVAVAIDEAHCVSKW